LRPGAPHARGASDLGAVSIGWRAMQRAPSSSQALLCVLALVACAGSDEPASDGGSLADAGEDAGAPDCRVFSAPMVLGSVDDARLAELSGLAASRRHPGLFYAHNDSGDVARVFVLDGSAH